MQINYLSEGAPSSVYGTELEIAIGRGGVATAIQVKLGEQQDFVGLVGDDGVLQATIAIGDESIGFAVSHIDDEARMVIRWMGQNQLQINIEHENREGQDCEPYCDDGTTGSPCVTCQAEHSLIMICC